MREHISLHEACPWASCQITFEKDHDLQVEMAVMEQLGNVLEDGENIFVGP